MKTISFAIETSPFTVEMLIARGGIAKAVGVEKRINARCSVEEKRKLRKKTFTLHQTNATSVCILAFNKLSFSPIESGLHYAQEISGAEV